MKGNLTIETFNKLLKNDKESSALILVLQKLTEVKQTDKLALGIPEPGPLGTWAGWSL